MKPVWKLLPKFNHHLSRIDPFSLQFRITSGIIGVSILGLGSVAVWMSWTTYQILIDSHKQNIVYLVDRLPEDIALYSEMMPVEVAVQKAINNISTPNFLIWVGKPDGTVIAQTETFHSERADNIAAAISSLSKMPSKPQISFVGSYYLVLGSKPLTYKKTSIGKLYIAQDITRDQLRFFTVVRNLSLVSLLAIMAIALTVATYVSRSLHSLRAMSHMTQVISADDLEKAQLQLDIAPSEVKDLAQTFNTMLARLSDAWKQQREFVSNVSHELRTPLTIVHGYLQSMQRRSQNLSEPQQEALAIAASETERVIRLLQDLLDLARADSGYLHLSWEPIDLKDLLHEVASMAERFSNRLIDVEIHPAPFKQNAIAIEVRADRNRLKQVLLNLVDNAVKYSEPDSPVTLQLHEFEDVVRLQVCDRGCGISLQHQTRIFDRFYRVDEARARSTGGQGLGLSIVKTLVESMGGQISVRSKPNEGSVFTVTLPTQLTKL